jgi:hypothetical protein
MNKPSHKGLSMLAAGLVPVIPARGSIGTACGLLVAAIVAAVPSARAQLNDPEGMDAIAAAVRVHGYACEQPRGATRDGSQSSSDEEAWIITCESGRYRVKFTGDTGSLVEPLE